MQQRSTAAKKQFKKLQNVLGMPAEVCYAFKGIADAKIKMIYFFTQESL